MIYLVEKGENKSKYEIRKVRYIESCKCNKLNIQYKDKVTNAYEEATITIWASSWRLPRIIGKRKPKATKFKSTRCRQSGLTPNTKARELLTLQFRPTAFRL